MTILGFLLAGGGTYFLVDPVYSATATLYVSSNSGQAGPVLTESGLRLSQQLVDTYIVILKSDSVLNKVAEQTDLGYTANQLRSMISASSTNGTEAFSVTVTNEDPAAAQKIVNTTIDVAPDEIIRVVKAGSVEVIDRAKLPTAPSSPSIPRNTAIGILLGLVLSVAVIVITTLFDTTIHTENDLEAFNIPILGVIPNLEHDNMIR